MNLQTVKVLSSLDEPVFQQFGADKIIQVMQQLGMKEEESIEHKMVTNAIRNMQEKMEKKIQLDQSARSQAEWLQKNYNPWNPLPVRLLDHTQTAVCTNYATLIWKSEIPDPIFATVLLTVPAKIRDTLIKKGRG